MKIKDLKPWTKMKALINWNEIEWIIDYPFGNLLFFLHNDNRCPCSIRKTSEQFSLYKYSALIISPYTQSLKTPIRKIKNDKYNNWHVYRLIPLEPEILPLYKTL